VGFKYRVSDSVEAEVRKSCRDELKILYSGGPFDDAAWSTLATLGQTSVLEASKINSKMKDLIRVRGECVRVEGARDGELVVAFFSPSRRGPTRHALEALLAGLTGRAPATPHGAQERAGSLL
jgi:hypothetical protein